MCRIHRSALLIPAVWLAGCAATGPPLQVVESVNLSRYAGKWYEIASYPAPFQEGCVGTTAEYSIREDGLVRVVNRCHDESLGGPVREVVGTARVVGPETNARLKVCFFWPFEGDYWIIDLGKDYEYAVVGEPRRRYLWILGRKPTMADAQYRQIVERLPAQGYDPDKLVRTCQPDHCTR
jgi:apolipoprotein D and lipocalin family protein